MSPDLDLSPSRPVPAILRRFTEPRFWAIQAAVLAITLVHIAFEGGLLAPGLEGGLEAAHHLPVVLYIAPVAYAGLSYGWEGGVLTGLWVGVLASINIVAWHLSDFEWITELAFVLVVITLGVVLSIPVERERWQRTRAEAAAKRLHTINQVVAATANPASTPVEAVKPALRRLARLLDLSDAGVVLWRRGDQDRVVEATASGKQDLLTRISDPPGGEGVPGVDAPTPSTRMVTVDTEHMRGCLLAEAQDGFSEDEDDLLVTIAYELAVRAENAMLVRQEQEMLTTYVRQVTKAQEEERRRLARDLHDGTAQQLAMLVRNLKQRASEGRLAVTLHEEASEILEEVRRVARDQRPPLLDDLGLVAALEWLVDQASARSTARVELDVVGSVPRFSAEIEVALYRVVQEALRNAERHADPETIRITMRFDEELLLTVEDDGRGFDVPLLAAGHHVRAGRLGLMGMQERSQLIGGQLEIHSMPGAGTTITLRVSL